MEKQVKQVNEIIQSPDYHSQDILWQDDDEETSDSSSTCSYDENNYSDLEPITVILNTITSENSVHGMSSYPNKILATIKINDKRNIQMKVDTGADICVLTIDDLQKVGFSLQTL